MNIVNFAFATPNSVMKTEVTDRHFGSSFENRTQTVDPDGVFATVAAKLPVKHLRYPGGSQTEAYFNPAEPEKERCTNIFDGRSHANFEPISEFIDYASSRDIGVIFVIPTFRYFNKASANSSYLSEAATAEIFNFVTDILSGKYGHVDIEAFEIGNEWFNARMLYDAAANPGGWTATEFGILQAKISEIVHHAVQQSQNQTPEIWVQSSQNGQPDMDGSGMSDNVEIVNGLAGLQAGVVDGVVDHFYQPTRADTPLGVINAGWAASARVARLQNDGWDIGDAGSMHVVSTEWNVRAARNGDLSGDDANITGFERLPILLGQFADMIQSGVTWANIYTIQGLGADGGAGALSFYGETELTPTGALFQIMGSTLPGTHLADPNADGRLSREEYEVIGANGDTIGVNYSFYGEGRLVLYFASVSAARQSFSLSGLDSYLDAGCRVEGSFIKISDDYNATDSNARAIVSHINYTDMFESSTEGRDIIFDLGAFEILQLEITDQSASGILPSFSNRFIYGSQNDDRLTGGAGANYIFGMSGDDCLLGGIGADSLNGGAGFDCADYVTSTTRVQVDLQKSTSSGGDASGDILVSIEGVLGSAFHDQIAGDGLDNFLSGLEGNDSLTGRAGNDTFEGGAGNDTLIGGTGFDFASYESSARQVKVNLALTIGQNTGGTGNDRLGEIEGLIGSGHSDTLYGNSSGNAIFGGAGNDTISGGAGSDTLRGGHGDDIFIFTQIGELPIGEVVDGGAGIDEVRVSLKKSGVFYLAPGVEVERVVVGTGLSSQADTSGKVAIGLDASRLQGGVELIGNAGANRLIGSQYADRIDAGSGNDTVLGGLGSDTISGGLGNDQINGGDGNDTAIYESARSAVRIDLAATVAQNTFGAGSDTLLSIENVVGSSYNDSLRGNEFANVLSGGRGDDTLHGGAGDDVLLGGHGSDILFGGSGQDRFQFNFQDQATDTILDFDFRGDDSLASDILAFQGVDPDSFEYRGDMSFTGTLGKCEARYAEGQVLVDFDGDGITDFTVGIVGLTSSHLLAAQDFLFI